MREVKVRVKVEVPDEVAVEVKVKIKVEVADEVEVKVAAMVTWSCWCGGWRH